MNKVKKLGILSMLSMIIVGCSCSKVDEKTYESAVNVYETTDGIYFTRLETIIVDGKDTQTRKKIEAKYLFDINKNVMSMDYSRSIYERSSVGSDISSSTTKYYYDGFARTLYTQLNSVNRYKQSGITYDEAFNINVSQYDELLMIKGYFAPVFKLNEVSEFEIKEDDGIANVSFYAVCPSYEKCNSNSEILKYKYVIGRDGTIESISYDIVNGDTTYSIRYTLHAYGSNNVKIKFPEDLESYIEK